MKNAPMVPLSSFVTELQGFRITLLERDEEKVIQLFQIIAASIEQYLKS